MANHTDDHHTLLKIGDITKFTVFGFLDLSHCLQNLTKDAKNLKIDLHTDSNVFKKTHVSLQRVCAFHPFQPTVLRQVLRFDQAISLSKYSGIDPSCIAVKLLLLAANGEPTYLNVIHPEQMQRALQTIEMLTQMQIPQLQIGDLNTNVYTNIHNTKKEFLQFYFKLQYT